MNFTLPIWARLAISAAWAVLKRVLASAGVPEAVVLTIEAVLQSLGLLGGGKQITHEEMHAKAKDIRACVGPQCEVNTDKIK